MPNLLPLDVIAPVDEDQPAEAVDVDFLDALDALDALDEP